MLLQRVASKNWPSTAGNTLAVITGLYPACLFLLLTARPFTAALLGLSLLGLLLVLNRAKEQALREPLIPADIWLLRQVFIYPHLYFPFLPMKGICTGFALVALIFAALLFLENPLPLLRNPDAAAALLCAVLLPPACLLLMRRGLLPAPADLLLRLCPPSHDAAKDAARNGLAAPLFTHPAWVGALERARPVFMRDHTLRPAAGRFPQSMEQMLTDLEAAPPDKLPHIVLIQAESFCDIRKYVAEPLKSELKDFLPNWDRLKAEGRAFDPPENAYGAYTMRTEFSMLTGLHAEDLGPWAFNPYLLAARQPLWSLARHLRGKGYASLCIHPYHKDFFDRDRAMPNLGFERFLGIAELDDLEKFGPYVSDKALGERILEEIATSETAGKPLFCFAITMEAHGPWLEGRLTDNEMAATLPDIYPKICDSELRMYLCHLRHMDSMFGILTEKVHAGKKISAWAYGDHAPGL